MSVFPPKMEFAMLKKIRESQGHTVKKGASSSYFSFDAAFVVENPSIVKVHAEVVPNESEVIRPWTQFYNRLTLCSFALFLVWITTLQVARAIVSTTIIVPSYHFVSDGCHYSYNEVVKFQAKYKTCVIEELDVCFNQLATDNDEEMTRIASVKGSNENLFYTFLTIEGNCSIQLDSAKAATKAWIGASPTQSIPYSGSCSTNEIDSTLKVLGSSTSSYLSAYSSSVDYSYNSQAYIDTLVNYVIAVDTYNSKYVSSKAILIEGYKSNVTVSVNSNFNITIENLNHLITCTALNASGVCPVGQSTSSLYATYVYFLEYSVNNFEASYKNLQESIKTQMAISEQSFGYLVNGVSAFMDYVLNNYMPSTNLCELTTPNWCDYLGGFTITAIFPTFPSLKEIKFVDPLQSSVINSFKKIIVNSLNSTKITVRDNNDITLYDYDPPIYPGNISTINDQYTESSEAFRKSVGQLLQRGLGVNSSDSSINNRTSIPSLGQESKFASNFLPFDSQSISIAFFLPTITSAAQVIEIFDIVYRILSSIHILIKYWSPSVVRLPSVDERILKGKQSNLLFFLYHIRAFSFLWTQIVLMIIVSFILLSILAGLFTFELNSYVAGCVTHTQSDTYISNILYSAAYNYAVYDGNQAASSGIERYNGDYSKYCSSGISATEKDYNSLLNSFQELNQSYQSIVEDIELASRCVNVTVLDKDFKIACCSKNEYAQYTTGKCKSTNLQCPLQNTLTKSPFLPLSSYLNKTECSSSDSIIPVQDGIFNCDHLESCTLTCLGPPAIIMHDLVKSCSCLAEWYIVASVLQIMFAVLIFILTNFSRILICDGLLRILWKSLTPAVFEYRADCDINGDLLMQDNENKSIIKFSAHSDDISGRIKEKLALSLTSFVKSGYIMIGIGILVNVGWIVLINQSSKNIVYVPANLTELG